VVVSVDQSRQEDVILQVQNFVGAGGQGRGRPDLFDDSIPNKKTTVGNLPALVIHRHQNRRVAKE
jgi:hypothetical protein